MRYFVLFSYCWACSALATSWDLIQKDLSQPFYLGVGAAHGQLTVESGVEEWHDSAHLFVGYRFDEVWAIELAGYRLKEDGQEWGSTSLPFVSIEHDRGVSLSLLGFAYYPEFAAYYRIGVQQDVYSRHLLTSSNSGSCVSSSGNFLCSEETKQVGWLVGLGTELPMSRLTALRLEWQSHWGSEDFEYHQAMASLMVSF